MANYETTRDLAQDLLQFFARALIASYFIANALGFIPDPNNIREVIAQGGLPNLVTVSYKAFEVLAASCVLLGYQTRLAALLLALLVFWTGFILNLTETGGIALEKFWQDIAMIGALLLAFRNGTGGITLDNMREQPPHADQRMVDALRVSAVPSPKPKQKAEVEKTPPKVAARV